MLGPGRGLVDRGHAGRSPRRRSSSSWPRTRTVRAMRSCAGNGCIPRRCASDAGSGATSYGTLARWLASRGYALHNMASLPHIYAAGGSRLDPPHGSGVGNEGLASEVRAIELLRASGEVDRLATEWRQVQGNRGGTRRPRHYHEPGACCRARLPGPPTGVRGPPRGNSAFGL